MREVVVGVLRRRRFHEDTDATELVEGGECRVGGQTGDREKIAKANARADHRGDAGDVARVGAELLESLADGGSHRARKIELLRLPSQPTAVALIQPSRLDERLERFLNKEWMTARPRV